MTIDPNSIYQSVSSTVNPDESEWESLQYHEWGDVRPVPDPDISLGVRMGLWLVAIAVSLLIVYVKEPSSDAWYAIAMFPVMTPPTLLIGCLGMNSPLVLLAYPAGCLYLVLLTAGGLSTDSSSVFVVLYFLFCLSLIAGCIAGFAILEFPHD